MRPITIALLTVAAASCVDGGDTDASCRCAPGLSCTSSGACVASTRSGLGPSCSSCSWAHDLCVEFARGETLADIREHRCGLIVCLVWHHQRTAACEESYRACATTCDPT